MKKSILLTLAFASTFALGFAVKSVTTSASSDKPTMKRVTGIGGIFFKCKDPKATREWYRTHLGLSTNDYGAVFEWHQGADSTKKGFTQWSPFRETTKYFEPSSKDFMINYRVENLVALVAQLKTEGVTVTDTIEASSTASSFTSSTAKATRLNCGSRKTWSLKRSVEKWVRRLPNNLFTTSCFEEWKGNGNDILETFNS